MLQMFIVKHCVSFQMIWVKSYAQIQIWCFSWMLLHQDRVSKKIRLMMKLWKKWQILWFSSLLMVINYGLMQKKWNKLEQSPNFDYFADQFPLGDIFYIEIVFDLCVRSCLVLKHTVNHRKQLLQYVISHLPLNFVAYCIRSLNHLRLKIGYLIARLMVLLKYLIL